MYNIGKLPAETTLRQASQLFLHILRNIQAKRQPLAVYSVHFSRHAGLSIATVQTVCKRFKALGLLASRYASYGVLKGMRYTLDKSVLTHPLQQNYPVDDPVSDREDNPGRRRPSQPATQSTTHRSGNVLKERQRDLSLSSSVLATTWPNLTRFGFGSAQVDQIVENLTALGKATDRVLQGLDHAEWELEQGKMCDKTGQPVADPCAWVFQSLARTGYYRRPAGYVSPEEQAAKDAEEEARAVVAAQRKAEQAQFEAWRDGLSPEALQNALKGHPGGPRDAWLRNVWKERLAREARRSPGKPGGGTGR